MIPADIQKCVRMLVGLMLFLVKFSCPDISNSVRELAKINDGATDKNFKQMLRAVKFVLDTCFKALKFKPKCDKKTMKYGISMAIVIVILRERKILD